jgi:NAD kinase
VTLAPRVVIVTRSSEYDELLARHGTRQAAGFFLAQRGRTLAEVEQRHELLDAAVTAVAAAIPHDWRRGRAERGDLDRFAFAPEDIVVAVGQDGLVANVAKYLDGQPVIGIDPEPERNPGVLVRHPPAAAGPLLSVAASPAIRKAPGRCMVEATADDGQRMHAINEIYVGHASHQSARYRLALPGDVAEHQSSSGIIAGTGTGATGWLASVVRERRHPPPLPGPDDARLCWFVREAWPSPATGTEHTQGTLTAVERLVVTAESDQLVVFGDGMEQDAIRLAWGQRIEIGVAAQRLRLVE